MKKLLIAIFTLHSLFSVGQSKKVQIQVLNFKLDSLNSEIVKERIKFESKLDDLNLKLNNRDMEISNKSSELQNLKEKLNDLNYTLNNRNVEISNKNTELQNLKEKLDNNILIVEELKVVNNQNSDSIKSLNKTVLLSNNKVDSLIKKIDLIISMNPVKTLLFNTSTMDMIYGNSLDIKNAEFEDYSKEYCDCMLAVSKFMDQNKDYGPSGEIEIDGYNQMSKSEKKIERAKEILLYYSLTECASFGFPECFSVLFDKEVLNLCDNW